MSHSRFVLVFLGLCLTSSLAWAAPVPSQVLPIVMKRPAQTYQRYQRLAPAQPTVTVRSHMSRLEVEQRQGKGWKTISTQALTFAGPEVSKTVIVSLPAKVPLSQLRVVAHSRASEPPKEAKIYEYVESGGYGWNWITIMPSQPVLRFNDINITANALMGTTNFAVSAGKVLASVATETDKLAPTATPAAAVESDIWQIAGKRLFFFNQYRGLQVIDLSDPKAPVRTGGVRLAASGDQMYVLDEEGSAVALLGKSTTTGNAGQQALFLIRISAGGVPELLHEIPLGQNVIDSRLIGKKLYLLQRQNSQVVTAPQVVLDSQFKIDASLETFDLTNPAAPIRLSKLEMSDGSSLQAAGQYLLVGTGALGLHVIKTDTASGAPVLVKTLMLKGAVQDKFKMGIANGAVVAITKFGNETWVESYPLEGSETAPLARTELAGARNETLYATRFDADRVYVVTFRRIDPLFVVDLADPAAPVVRGILEIPGWSTYLQPMGDRLLAIGLEWGLPTVSLFDVADPAAPSLLSRLTLGDGGYVNSEATWDEKAVEFFPEEGLVLVPYSGWNENGAVNMMQAVQIGRDTLTLGTAIPHKSLARRGAVVGDHFVSISGQELLVVDRTKEEGVEAELSLSWRVDHVVPFGDYLVQVENGMGEYYYLSTKRAAKLRVSHRHDPDALIEELLLGPGEILGIAQKGQRLFVAQQVEEVAGAGQRRLRTWVLNLGSPPAVAQVTSVEHPFEGAYLNEVKGHWVNDTTLVWYASLRPRSGYGGLISLYGGPVLTIGSPIIALRPAVGTGTLILNGNTGVINSSLVAVDTTFKPWPESPPATAEPVTVSMMYPIINATSTPAAGAVIKVGSEKAFRSGQAAFTRNGCLFAGYEEELPYTGNQLLTYGLWYRTVRPWLQIVDFNVNPPVVRAPVSIQGELLNVTQGDDQGTLLFTHRQENSDWNGTHAVHAMDFDGTLASDLDSTSIAPSSLSGYAADGHRFYFIRNGDPGVIGLGFNLETGKFAGLGSWTTEAYPSLLQVLNGHLLASAYASLETAIIGPDGSLSPATIFDHLPNLLLGVDRLAPTDQGVLIPAFDYGVEFLSWTDFDEK